MLDGDQWQLLADTFLGEARDLMMAAEQSMQWLESDMGDSEAINQLFRAVHTLKGSAGLLGAEALVSFAHQMESVLSRVRDGELALEKSLLRLFYHCLDQLSDYIEALADGTEILPATETRAQVETELARYLDQTALAPTAQDNPQNLERMQQSADLRDQAWHISLRFDPELYRNGFDPASFLRYLARLGTLSQVYLLCDGIPDDPEQYDPERCHLGLELNLIGDTDKAAIEAVFEFIEALATLRILPPQSQLDDYIELIRALPEDDQRLGEILVEVGLLTPRELNESLDLQGTADPARKLGEVVVAEHMVAPEAVREALEKQKTIRERRPETSYLKIAAHKMDALVNQVGELVVAAAGTRMLANQSRLPDLTERAEFLCRQVELIRESTLALRMVEVGETFNRFHRLVREASENLGKSIRLEISGADTELDKTLVDRLYDPLVHLVRNAVDHGIESTEHRSLAGKPEQARIFLNAYHESGMIVIEVQDDGAGIDAAKVRTKALEQGLISADQELDEETALRLIFEPGFSTAAAVTNLSGRGVGMDSVLKSIDALRGSIDIDNRPGQGCCFRIRLPLTLAIIDGFLVSIHDQFFVIPLEHVTECMEAPEDIQSRQGDGYLELRGKAMPYADLRDHFRIGGQRGKRQSLVVVRHGQASLGLLVDMLHGEIQTVIKPLGSIFEHLPGVAGASILGSGDVALTLDITGILKIVNRPASARGKNPQPVPGRQLNQEYMQ